jgi:hypothetical protein
MFMNLLLCFLITPNCAEHRRIYSIKQLTTNRNLHTKPCLNNIKQLFLSSNMTNKLRVENFYLHKLQIFAAEIIHLTVILAADIFILPAKIVIY